MNQAPPREVLRWEMWKERQRVRNYEWTGSTLCLAVLIALLLALTRGCCSPTDKTGESCSIFLHRPPGNLDDPNYNASHLGAVTLVFLLGQMGQSYELKQTPTRSIFLPSSS